MIVPGNFVVVVSLFAWLFPSAAEGYHTQSPLLVAGEDTKQECVDRKLCEWPPFPRPTLQLPSLIFIICY